VEVVDPRDERAQPLVVAQVADVVAHPGVAALGERERVLQLGTASECGHHRGELKALLREQYGTLGWHPWAKGPHPWAGRRGTDRARRLRRTLVAGLGR
jgi:hypothetical protein